MSKLPILAVISVTTSLGICQIQASSVGGKEVLRQPIKVADLHATAAGAVSVILSGAHLAGGIISVGGQCLEPTEYDLSLRGATIEEALNRITALDGSGKWSYDEGLIIFGQQLLEKTVLETTIRENLVLADT